MPTGGQGGDGLAAGNTTQPRELPKVFDGAKNQGGAGDPSKIFNAHTETSTTKNPDGTETTTTKRDTQTTHLGQPKQDGGANGAQAEKPGGGNLMEELKALIEKIMTAFKSGGQGAEGAGKPPAEAANQPGQPQPGAAGGAAGSPAAGAASPAGGAGGASGPAGSGSADGAGGAQQPGGNKDATNGQQADAAGGQGDKSNLIQQMFSTVLQALGASPEKIQQFLSLLKSGGADANGTSGAGSAGTNAANGTSGTGGTGGATPTGGSSTPGAGGFMNAYAHPSLNAPPVPAPDGGGKGSREFEMAAVGMHYHTKQEKPAEAAGA
jgi:hypothetical protein